MATKGSIGIRRQKALERINKALAALAEGFDLEPLTLPKGRQRDDPDLRFVQQLEALEHWLTEAVYELRGPEWGPVTEEDVAEAVRSIAEDAVLAQVAALPYVDDAPLWARQVLMGTVNLRDMDGQELRYWARGSGFLVAPNADPGALLRAILEAADEFRALEDDESTDAGESIPGSQDETAGEFEDLPPLETEEDAMTERESKPLPPDTDGHLVPPAARAIRQGLIDLEGMTVTELRGFASAQGIDLGDAKKKADILTVIEAWVESWQH